MRSRFEKQMEAWGIDMDTPDVPDDPVFNEVDEPNAENWDKDDVPPWDENWDY